MENEKKIWNWLRTNTPLNEFAVAGIMGNIQAESAGLPDNLENRANSLLGMSDNEYTAAVDSGKYTKTDFATDGKIAGGYGLCQWTYYTRKMELYDYCKMKGVSIADLESQLEFMVKEMQEHYPAVWRELLTVKTIKAASDVVLYKYENPANAAAQSSKRAEYGQNIYERNAGKTEEPKAALSDEAREQAAELLEKALKLLKGV